MLRPYSNRLAMFSRAINSIMYNDDFSWGFLIDSAFPYIPP